MWLKPPSNCTLGRESQVKLWSDLIRGHLKIRSSKISLDTTVSRRGGSKLLGLKNILGRWMAVHVGRMLKKCLETTQATPRQQMGLKSSLTRPGGEKKPMGQSHVTAILQLATDKNRNMLLDAPQFFHQGPRWMKSFSYNKCVH